MSARVIDAFTEAFHRRPALVVRGPGRVNLLGEHTDYNAGFVLPGAIDKAIHLALAPRTDGQIRLVSVDLGERVEVSERPVKRHSQAFANYLLGVISELAALDLDVPGVDVAFGGDVPIGSGLSSSAALECGFAFGLSALFGFGLSRVELARLGQRSENRFVGVNCGIMDQFASLLGQAGQVIHLDCRDLSYEYAPFARADLVVALADTQVRRALAGSEYNVRRAQCEAAVAAIARHDPRVKTLRDASEAHLAAINAEVSPVVLKRAQYVVGENRRVQAAVAALAAGDYAALGALMNTTHHGLRDLYEVSSPELDALQAAVEAVPGVFGARMMGAGFGGCTLNLVEEAALPDFKRALAPAFASLGKPPVIHICHLTGGTELL